MEVEMRLKERLGFFFFIFYTKFGILYIILLPSKLSVFQSVWLSFRRHSVQSVGQDRNCSDLCLLQTAVIWGKWNEAFYCMYLFRTPSYTTQL